MNRLQQFLETKGNGYFHIGHASGLLRIGGKLILFDPFWDAKPFSEYWSIVPENYNCNTLLDNVHAIFVSHIHDDHYTESIIKKSKCPVYIMDGRPDLAAKLNKYRQCVVEIPRERRYVLFDGETKCYFIPHSFNTVDSSVFVFNNSFCFYHGNDNFVDFNSFERLYENSIHRLREVLQPDIACIPYAYLNWYPECMIGLTKQQKRDENERLSQKLFLHAQKLIEILNPKFVVPAAASLYYNGDLFSPFNDQGMTPWEFAEISGDSRVTPLGPGDFISNNDINSKWNNSTFKEEVGNNLRSKVVKPKNAKVVLLDYHIRTIEELLKAAPRIPNHEIWFPIDNQLSLVIDLEKQTARKEFTKIMTKPMTMIWIENAQLIDWLNRVITFEMVVATRRFKMLRVPEEYNVTILQLLLNYL